MRSRLSAIFGSLLFAVCFGGVGALTGWLAGTVLYDGIRARDWVAVEAEVTGDDVYRYVLAGNTYTSERLTLLRMGSSDVDGSDEVSARLSQAKSAGKPVRVWVNPANPHESVAERGIPWMFLVAMSPFVLGFGGVGAGALWFAGRNALDLFFPGRRARRERPAAPAAHDGKVTLKTRWLMAFFWNALAIPVSALALMDAFAGGDKMALLVLIFPLVGLALLWGAVAASWARIREWRAAPDVSASGKVL